MQEETNNKLDLAGSPVRFRNSVSREPEVYYSKQRAHDDSSNAVAEYKRE